MTTRETLLTKTRWLLVGAASTAVAVAGVSILPATAASSDDVQQQQQPTGNHVVGEPWPADANPPLLYQTHEVRNPRGILFVAGQTPKSPDGKTYVHQWDMPAQIDRNFDQVIEQVRKAGYQPSDITQLRYSTTDEDLFVKYFDRVAARLQKEGIKPTSAAIGVERLAQPGVLLEIEAVAVR
ncbi:RidA family protein [Kibdelosporangium aridum]|uniref:RidA family protein n=1 Tax=Kibdelosporangium aridum TaxID=2030 RepID=UPI00052689BE